MPAPEPPPKPPFTIPLADGPMPVWADRTLALVVVVAAITAFSVLWPLVPDARGFDTHTQLGMQPCSWPAVYGLPCPTCGCTTAACHVVHGDLLRAFLVQPFGAAVAAAGLLLAAFAVFCLLRARSFADRLARLPRGRILLVALALLLAGWGVRAWHFLRVA